MGVLRHWERIVAWLDHHAPSTVSAFVPPEDDAAVEALALASGLAPPDDLRSWWAVCGGTANLAFAEVLPPFYTPLGPSNALRSWRLKERFWPVDLDSEAGTPTLGFHPMWLPIAFDGCGDALAVDLRPGVLCGCVVEWDRQAGEMLKPEWTSLDEMLDEVATALEHWGRLGHCEPLVTTDGRLGWRTD
ncbi:cell wall assembly regulator SMI1 [Saccharothrix ecbatanensis]|uniref:Cell wall assembly regulator SMI1 n=1 Tax=Saccharothrix ecbatanensis TaxID=1105145 RepID=A0A7W9M3H3_9PSEU|nr:SMI1/KNR4 family protein [Saccharothrix ecbatanensis]MBB5806024.1 cell wall assembly regulator SMI1 [Saccharothrix ecbatanensis]